MISRQTGNGFFEVDVVRAAVAERRAGQQRPGVDQAEPDCFGLQQTRKVEHAVPRKPLTTTFDQCEAGR